MCVCVGKRAREGISKQSRGKGEINLWQLIRLAKKFEGKVLVTTSKILSFGDLGIKIKVASPEFSGKAKEKIRKAGGEAISLDELMEGKYKESEMVLVK